MNKKFLSILSILLVFVLIFTGCSKKTDNASTTKSGNKIHKK